MTKEQMIEGTLLWCNGVRAGKGLPTVESLPKGRQKDEKTCPCGQLTGFRVNRFWFTDESGEKLGNLPDVVKTFVDYFDNGLIPELIQGRFNR